MKESFNKEIFLDLNEGPNHFHVSEDDLANEIVLKTTKELIMNGTHLLQMTKPVILKLKFQLKMSKLVVMELKK